MQILRIKRQLTSLKQQKPQRVALKTNRTQQKGGFLIQFQKSKKCKKVKQV
ncbi:hypothetical protein [Bacillus safensis]|uniref:hypothetical protein n=1 Tax=Bacillus safensis TaxID=561879 RepID=UPI00131466E1|nr:hypothetical protein [Bacillus safensis]